MDRLKYRALIEAAVSMREAMLAENKMREQQGYALAYGEQCFIENAERFEELARLIQDEKEPHECCQIRKEEADG